MNWREQNEQFIRTYQPTSNASSLMMASVFSTTVTSFCPLFTIPCLRYPSAYDYRAAVLVLLCYTSSTVRFSCSVPSSLLSAHLVLVGYAEPLHQELYLCRFFQFPCLKQRSSTFSAQVSKVYWFSAKVA